MRIILTVIVAMLMCGFTTGAHAAPIFSSQERAEGLRQGLGMGLALPADNNGYPGPRHVLDLADALSLTPQQRQQTEALYASMRAEAIPAANRLLADEAALDRLFIDRQATRENIRIALQAIAASAIALQSIHLDYHLSMTGLLTADQVREYSALRAAPRTRPQPLSTSAGEHDRH